MIANRFRGAAVVVLAILFGCSQAPRKTQTAEQLSGRLDAAKAMTNTTERNEALKAIAEDAAEAGVGDVVVKALEGITNTTTKNDAAETCARKLAKRGDTKAATAVAELITNTTKKNEVLGQIAKGNP